MIEIRIWVAFKGCDKVFYSGFRSKFECEPRPSAKICKWLFPQIIYETAEYL